MQHLQCVCQSFERSAEAAGSLLPGFRKIWFSIVAEWVQMFRVIVDAVASCLHGAGSLYFTVLLIDSDAN